MSRITRFPEYLPMKGRISLLLLLLFLVPLTSVCQQRCGTTDYRTLLEKTRPQESEQKFEEWMEQKQTTQKLKPSTGREAAIAYNVSVVVHVIHNGEGIGQGANISDAQILSQIEVLNLDFQRLNADAEDTPTEFAPVAGSMDLEFGLAEIDPAGNPTTGINRVKGPKPSWNMADDVQLKSLSYWNANNYLNIWVCNLNDFAGYSQFPISTLPGLENSSTDPLTDGIVIKHTAFGSSDYGNFVLGNGLERGRTATHELGHFLGLRHIWGDESNCDGTDYVSDTPPQSGSTSGCPSHPQLLCPSASPRPAMFQNYLDLTDDACLNLFTKGQVVRMRTVLENSPRRASLLQTPSQIDGRQFEKIFSPNDDGVNDYWKWSDYNKYSGCNVKVFNRFGKMVYEMSTYDGSWNGRALDGRVLEEEAYFYIISCAGSPDVTGGVRIVR
jgi:gliding motility-associated-like protein